MPPPRSTVRSPQYTPRRPTRCRWSASSPPCGYAGVVLAVQSFEGLHDDEAERQRLLNSASTLIVHRLADPDPVIARAGTIRRAERSHQLDPTGATGMGSLRLQDAYRVDPNRCPVLARRRRLGCHRRTSVQGGYLTRGAGPPRGLPPARTGKGHGCRAGGPGPRACQRRGNGGRRRHYRSARSYRRRRRDLRRNDWRGRPHGKQRSHLSAFGRRSSVAHRTVPVCARPLNARFGCEVSISPPGKGL